MAAPNCEFSWVALKPFGVEIQGDLSQPLSPSGQVQFRRLLLQHKLLVAPSQHLSMPQQQALAGLLGPILLRQGESGYLSNEVEHDAATSGLSFHSDAAYTEHPFTAIGLHAVDVVDGASTTLFANADLTVLPEPLRQALSNLQVELISPGIHCLAQRVCDIPAPDAMKRGIFPAIQIHPETQQGYINLSEMHAARLQGIGWPESRALLNEIYTHLYSASNIYTHTWRQGDLVLWDNRALQHARGSLKTVGRRILQRVIVGVEGAIPFSH